MIEFKNKRANAADKAVREFIDAGIIGLQPETSNGGEITVNNSPASLSNYTQLDYLGLSSSPKAKEAAVNHILQHGISKASPRPYLTSPNLNKLELLLEELFQAHVLVATSTTLIHIGCLPILLQDNDLVIFDQFAHNSISVGISACSAKIKTKMLPHNDIEKLEKILSSSTKDESINNIWYLADSIYSFKNSFCPMDKIAQLLKKYNNFFAYIDDAHGMSIYGKNGCGYALSAFETVPEKLVVATSLNKGFGMGGGGAIIIQKQEIKDKIKRCGPSFIFSTPPAEALCAVGVAQAEIHLSGEIHQYQQRLSQLCSLFDSLCSQHGISNFFHNMGKNSPLYIMRLKRGENVKLIQALMPHGIFVGCGGFPAVPKNYHFIRILITLNFSAKDIEHLALSLAKEVKQLGITP